MKVLTAAQMREVDRRTIESGIPGLILMENAGARVVEFLAETFAPLEKHRIVILCGKGNNGGDGLVVARQLCTRFRPRSLSVVLAAEPGELRGDAADNLRALTACGCPHHLAITVEMRRATIVVDALLGTGLSGAASGRMLDWIREINHGFPDAKVVAVDIPSGLPSDSPHPSGEFARVDYTVTFTAPKAGQVLPPNCDSMGILRVVPIGSPPALYEDDDSVFLSLVEPGPLRQMFAPRAPGTHKGDFGHVLIAGGWPGKTGAAAMTGMAALRAGAGLVTVLSHRESLSSVSAHAPELMTEAWDPQNLPLLMRHKDVIAVGPGLGQGPGAAAVVREVITGTGQPVVLDADALNVLADTPLLTGNGLRILTPHPGEMARLIRSTTAEVQADRVGVARSFTCERKVILVLKGQRTLIAFPDGRVWINPTGTAAMATAGSGDILTGLIAGLLAQFPNSHEQAIAAAVWLHGRAGELGAAVLGEKSLVATDLLRYLPEAIRDLRNAE